MYVIPVSQSGKSFLSYSMSCDGAAPAVSQVHSEYVSKESRNTRFFNTYLKTFNATTRDKNYFSVKIVFVLLLRGVRSFSIVVGRKY